MAPSIDNDPDPRVDPTLTLQPKASYTFYPAYVLLTVHT